MKKTCFNAKTNDFDQQTDCGAPICLSKYTTIHTGEILKEKKNLRTQLSLHLFISLNLVHVVAM